MAKIAVSSKMRATGPVRLWTEDVSIGGVCLIAHHDLADDEIYLQFLVPACHDACFRCAVVRRTVRRRVSITGRMWREYSYGVRIMEQVRPEDLPTTVNDEVSAERCVAQAAVPESDHELSLPRPAEPAAEPAALSSSGDDAAPLSDGELQELLGRTIGVVAEVPAGRTYVPLFSALGLVVIFLWLDVMW